MSLTLTEDQCVWQAKAREFARDVIAPVSLARDRIPGAHEPFDWGIIHQGSKLGFRTAVVAKQWGGHGIDFVTQALVITELAKGDSAIAKTFSQCWKWSHMMAAVCTPDQQQRFLRAFVEDDTFLLGHAGTEPNAGSDHRLPPDDDPRAGWMLKAERRGDEWILNGEKCFIANGGVAKLYFVSTRTNPHVSQREGSTEFLVPIDTPGLRIGKIFNKSGWRFYQNGELIFEDARVPHANIVGKVNGGFDLRTGTSAPFGDLELGANALGICDCAIEQATHEARTRRRGSAYFKDNQAIQLKLSEMHMLTEALRSFVLRVAMEADDKSAHHGSINHLLLQNFATEASRQRDRYLPRFLADDDFRRRSGLGLPSPGVYRTGHTADRNAARERRVDPRWRGALRGQCTAGEALRARGGRGECVGPDDVAAGGARCRWPRHSRGERIRRR